LVVLCTNQKNEAMNYLLLLFVTILSFNTFSEIDREWMPRVSLISSEIDSSLVEGESQYIFEFNNLQKGEGGIKIIFSIDSVTHNGNLDQNNKLYIKSTPGAHIFQFFYNDEYEEVYSDSLLILDQHKNTYRVHFQSSRTPVILKKPVIYLYPDKPTNFTVNVKPVGELIFTYPKYSDSWTGNASPNGDLTIDGNTYSYLFWEANQALNVNFIDTKKGAIVKGNESLMFLENQLEKFGFNSKEKADFITFWAPQLQQNEFNYIHFVINSGADEFAELTITPKPDAVFRFYMLFSEVDNPSNFKTIEPQVFDTITRSGFTVFEWGGSKIKLNQRLIQLSKL